MLNLAGMSSRPGSVPGSVTAGISIYPCEMPKDSSGPQWYTVRCLFGAPRDKGFVYEERMTLWCTDSFENAISFAEKEAAVYAKANKLEYLDLAQVCLLPGHPTSGAEVFSLVRDSELGTDEYLDAFFDTGTERQSAWNG
jgi:hypothetical protein